MAAWTRALVVEINGKEWLYSGLISKVESSGFADGLDMGCGRLLQNLGLHNWINGGTTCQGEHMGKWDIFNVICP